MYTTFRIYLRGLSPFYKTLANLILSFPTCEKCEYEKSISKDRTIDSYTEYFNNILMILKVKLFCDNIYFNYLPKEIIDYIVLFMMKNICY